MCPNKGCYIKIQCKTRKMKTILKEWKLGKTKMEGK